jgi:hypothetical protein
MDTQPPFVLTRATAQDLLDILNVYYHCFSESDRTIFQGCTTIRDIPMVQQSYTHDMKADHSDVWVQVRDAKTGQVVAASNWKVYVNGEPDDMGQRVPSWLEDVLYHQSKDAIETITTARKTIMNMPFIRNDPQSNRKRQR